MLRQIVGKRIAIMFDISFVILVLLWVFYVNLRLRDSYSIQSRAMQLQTEVDGLKNEVKTLRDICDSRLSSLEREVFGATPIAPTATPQVSQKIPEWQVRSTNELRRRVTVLEEWRLRHGIQ